MKYASIKLNDIANASGVCVSVYTQGCPHHCPGCFNPETWDFESGKEFTEIQMQEIINGLTANGVQRNLCILGGEPLCPQNKELTQMIIDRVREVYPSIKIYIWTGYLIEDLTKDIVDNILIKADVLIDGPFMIEKKDLTLTLRGSSNQRVIDLTSIK